MHRLILAVLAIVATTAAAEASDCSGQGSATTLVVEDWALVRGGAGAIELRFRLNEDKPVTLLAAHLYFEIGGTTAIADVPLELTDPAGLPLEGNALLTVSKPMTRQLVAATPATVTVTACTNYMEYLDGSGVIID